MKPQTTEDILELMDGYVLNVKGHLVVVDKFAPSGSSAPPSRLSSTLRDSLEHPAQSIDFTTAEVVQTRLPRAGCRDFSLTSVLDAAYAVKHGQPHSPEQFHVWQAIVRIADQFESADKYLVSLPMWNFSIPYKLKHYIIS